MTRRRNNFTSESSHAELDMIESLMSVPLTRYDVAEITGMTATKCKDFITKLIADGRIVYAGKQEIQGTHMLSKRKMFISTNPSKVAPDYVRVTSDDPEEAMESMIQAQHEKFMQTFSPEPDWSQFWMPKYTERRV